MSLSVEPINANRLNLKTSLKFDLLLGLLPLIMLTPMLASEFQLLWSRSGMRFFPIPIFLAACVAALNLRSCPAQSPLRVFTARMVFLASVVTFGYSVWRLSPWLAHASFVLLFVSWASERLGNTAWPRVLGWAVLLATSMRLPGDLNSQLQGWLVSQSSTALGKILDGLAIPYLIQADTFSMKGLEFSLSQVCDGVYSIHALASAVVLLLLLRHRSFLVSIISVLTLPLWVATQYLVLLLIIVFLKHNGNRDASQGIDHTLVTLAVFGLMLICYWMTSWFLAKILQPVPAADSEFELQFLFLNSVLCWPQADPFLDNSLQTVPIAATQAGKERFPTISRALQSAAWLGCIAMLAFGMFSTHRWVYGGYGQAKSQLPNVNVERLETTEWKKSFPETLGALKLNTANFEIRRDHGSNVERAALHWQFGWQGQVIQLSVTIPFNSRPPLASKYEAMGWRILAEQTKKFTLPASGPVDVDIKSPEQSPEFQAQQVWTELSIVNDLGGRAYAMVTYYPLDIQSKPNKAQASEAAPGQSLEYQVMLFCESGEELTRPQLNELSVQFQRLIKQLRKELEPNLRELIGEDP